MKLILLTLLFCLGLSCSSTAQTPPIINPNGATLHTRFSPPKGYERPMPLKGKALFFGNLPLKPDGSPVYLYNGTLKGNQTAHCAVVDWSIGTKDLFQCADASMRLDAEYWYAQNNFETIHYNFTNGFKCSFSKWAEGYRPNSTYTSWVKSKAPDASYSSFSKYLELVYSYAGSASLSKELTPVAQLKDVQVGDVFIRGGFPGHVCTVMDVAHNAKGEKVFLLSQSYMPAQNLQILNNPNSKDGSPWYGVADLTDRVETPEYTFSSKELMRFNK